jgi:hypothetical protein
MCTSIVGCIFVGETERQLQAMKYDYLHICTLRHKVGEIDLKSQKQGMANNYG